MHLLIIDDDLGRINGILPGDKNYLTAALDRSQVVFSNLADNPIDRQFDSNSQRYLNFAPGDHVQFCLIADDTLDNVKTNPSTAKVLFSLPEANPSNSNQAQFTDLLEISLKKLPYPHKYVCFRLYNRQFLDRSNLRNILVNEIDRLLWIRSISILTFDR